jgi:hypothetical protein
MPLMQVKVLALFGEHLPVSNYSSCFSSFTLGKLFYREIRIFKEKFAEGKKPTIGFNLLVKKKQKQTAYQ